MEVDLGNIVAEGVVGLYWCEGHGGTVEVRRLPHLHEGFEYADGLELEWADGIKVTVTDAAVAIQYLKTCSAKKAG